MNKWMDGFKNLMGIKWEYEGDYYNYIKYAHRIRTGCNIQSDEKNDKCHKIIKVDRIKSVFLARQKIHLVGRQSSHVKQLTASAESGKTEKTNGL